MLWYQLYIKLESLIPKSVSESCIGVYIMPTLKHSMSESAQELGKIILKKHKVGQSFTIIASKADDRSFYHEFDTKINFDADRFDALEELVEYGLVRKSSIESNKWKYTITKDLKLAIDKDYKIQLESPKLTQKIDIISSNINQLAIGENINQTQIHNQLDQLKDTLEKLELLDSHLEDLINRLNDNLENDEKLQEIVPELAKVLYTKMMKVAHPLATVATLTQAVSGLI